MHATSLYLLITTVKEHEALSESSYGLMQAKELIQDHMFKKNANLNDASNK